MTPEFRLMSDIYQYRNVVSIMKNAEAIEGLWSWHEDELYNLDNYTDGRAIAPEYLDFRKK